MTDTTEFIEDFLKHEYDPIKARAYYLRTRKLKGRRKGVNPRSKLDFDGNPLKPLGKRIEEDETPDVSPTGAKLVDYDGKGLGKATYADGSVYDPSVGWKQRGRAAVASARATNNAQRAKSGANPRHRVAAAEQRLTRAKTRAAKVKDPNARATLLNRISMTERTLKRAKAKYSPSVRRDLRE